MEYYTLHVFVIIMIFFVGLLIGIFGFIPLKKDVYKISDYHFHPKNTFKIPFIWYKYVYELKTVDNSYFVEFYVNNTNDNSEIYNAIYETINCARNEIIGNSIVHFIKPVYDTILVNKIQDKHISVFYKSYSVVDIANQ